MAKIILFAIIALKCLTITGQNYYFKPQFSTIINSDKRQYMCRPASRQGPGIISSYWNISQSDVEQLENNFMKIVKLKSQEASVDDLKNYAFQYAGIIVGGKRYIYINAFYSKPGTNPEYSHNNWKNDPVRVRDGGSHYWGVMFSIEDHEFNHLEFNGSA
jgi:hypothetical protein